MTTLEEKLRYVLETLDIGNAMTEPLTESIRKALEVSALRLKAEGASVLVRDADTNDLYFLMATGKVADKLKGMRVPAGRGVAGFVFSSGQQMAIADVAQESAFYAEIDKQTGYNTQILLATPLKYREETIGVLEYVNRSGEPPYEPFTSEEMDEAVAFAEIIASLVHTYEAVRTFRQLGESVIKHESTDLSDVQSWITDIRSSPEHQEMAELAILIRELTKRGDAERRLCRDLIKAILKYSDYTKIY